MTRQCWQPGSRKRITVPLGVAGGNGLEGVAVVPGVEMRRHGGTIYERVGLGLA